MHCMQPGATLAPFRAPISEISYFDFFGSIPEIFEKLPKTFKISITDVWFLTKKVVPSVYAVYEKLFLVYQCFDLI